MPKYYEYKIAGYYLYFTSYCVIECMHVHASDRKLTEAGSAKFFVKDNGDMANRNSPIITVIPMSSKLKKLELPVHIPVTWRDCEMLRDEGLEESILLVEQITTIDKMVLCNRHCRVTSAKKKQEIEAAVKKQFAMQACMGREAQA